MSFQIKIVLIAAALLVQNILEGQGIKEFPGPGCTQEKIEILVSQESVFTDEILWFKVYCTSPLFPGKEISNLAFVELVSSENTSVIRKKILLRNGEGTGEFRIPENLSTGLYYILAYTNWMKNFGELSFFRKAIIIVNPDQPLNNYSVRQNGEQNYSGTPEKSESDKLKLVTDKKSYSIRDKASLRIETAKIAGKAITGKFSVAVYQKEPQMIFSKGTSHEEAIVRDPGKIVFLPDYRGIRLTGKLTDPSGNPLPGVLVTESTPGPGTNINSTISDSDGNFHFLLKAQEGDQDILITLPDADTRISLEESFWNGFRNPPDNLSLILESDAVSFLNKKYAYFQLQNRFDRHSSSINSELKMVTDSSLFYTKPYQLIEFGNYINLDSLREYFYELVPSVKFTQKRGDFEISVIDPVSQLPLKNRPGVFLDGVFYDNYAELANVPVGEIDRMAVLPATYYYNDFTFGGIIDIHTKTSDFNIVKPLPNMTRFIYSLANQREWNFSSPEYSGSDSLSRIPDLRSLLLWEPDVIIGSSGEVTIRFFSGDITGSFVVKVVGISDEGELLKSETDIFIGE